jgi:flagellar biosynthetic protein FliR
MELLAFSAEELGAWLGTLLWPLCRVSGFIMVAPVLGSQLVPVRLRLIIAVVLTLLIMPGLPPMPQIEALSLQAGVLVGQQLLLGAALGFFLQMVFHALVLAGQMVAMQMGLGFASMMDPANGVNVTVLSNFYLMFVTALFVTLDGHLRMLEVLGLSFVSFPIGQEGDVLMSSMSNLFSTMGWVFSSAMIIALPALTALLITNCAFGIMTRAAPQLNIFALGFPVALLLGLFFIWLTLGAVADAASALFADSFLRLNDLLAP